MALHHEGNPKHGPGMVVYPEGLVGRLRVGLGGVGTRGPRQLTGCAGHPLSCSEHFARIVGVNWNLG